MDAGEFKVDVDGRPLSASQRFNYFMFQLETLASYAAADGWELKDFVHMCAMAWGVANHVNVEFTAMPTGEEKPQ